MIEVIRMVTAALEHETYGVNEQLLTIPVDEGDRQPPEIVKVLDETQDQDLEMSPDFPILEVTVDTPITATGEPRPDKNVIRDYEVPIAIRYATRGAENDRVRQDSWYTLRAIVRVLDHLIIVAPEADRTRNSVKLNKKTNVQLGIVDEVVEGSEVLIAAGLIATFHARDTAPAAS